MAEQHGNLEQQLATNEHAHETPHVNYWVIFAALIGLTLLSVLADTAGHNLGKVIITIIVMIVASFKASAVMLYFMHLKYEGRWKFILLLPTMILAMALIIALIPDIGAHYYTVEVPQTEEGIPVNRPAHGDEHISPLGLE